MASHRRHMKFLQSLHESEPPPSLKIKSLIKAHVLGHLRRAIGSLTSTKSMFMQLVNNKSSKKKKKTTKTKKRLLSFLKLHLHLSSSHVAPVQEIPGSKRSDADPKWRFASFSTEKVTIGAAEAEPSSLAGYLDWLERSSEPPPPPEGGVDDDDGRSEIDRLADKFIASCHERFRLEKQESYRRYQEMLARSM